MPLSDLARFEGGDDSAKDAVAQPQVTKNHGACLPAKKPGNRITNAIIRRAAKPDKHSRQMFGKKLWHPVGDSNPCCRRERAVS